MRKILFFTDRVKAAILPGTKRAHALLARHKKLSYGSAAILALLVAPFAVQAMAPAFADGDEPAAEHIEETVPDVKASVDGHTQSGSSSEVEINSNSQASGSSDSDVDVTINGQKVPVPENGSIHKRMGSNGSETIVDVQIDSGSSANSSSSSSTTIMIDNHSSGSDNDKDERNSTRRLPRR